MGQKQNKVAQERQAEDSLGQAEGIWTHNSFANLSILSIWSAMMHSLLTGEI